MATASSSDVGASKPSRKGGGVRWKLFKSRSSKSDSKLASSRGEEADQDSTPGPRASHTYNYYISGGRGGSGGLGGLFGGRGGTGEGPIIQLPQPPLSAAIAQASQVYLNHCPPASSIFRGRQAILEVLHQFFAQGTQKQKIYVLYGLGGIGKTQIALKFIQDSNCFTEKFLVDASSTESIETCLKSIAAAKEIGNSSQDTLTWLAGEDGDWLVFLDNADDPEMNLQKFFPKCSHGNIIITTRNPGLRVYGEYSQVSDMEESDAVALLLQRACQKPSPANEALGIEIVKTVPNANDVFHQQYVHVYHEAGQHTNATVLQAAIVEKQRKLLGDDHLDTLHAMKTLAELYIVQRHFSKAEKLLLIALDKLRRLLGDDHLTTQHVLFNLVQTYKQLDKTAEVAEFKKLIHNSASPQDQSLEQLRDALQAQREFLGDNNCQTLDAMHSLASRYFSLGQFEEAEELEIVVLDKQRELLGDDHLATLLVMNNLGWTYYCQNRILDAEEILVPALDKLKSLVGDDHPDTQRVLQNLVWTYWRLTKWKEAAELEKLIHNDASKQEQSLDELEDALEAKRDFLSDDNFQTLRTTDKLANRYSSLGQFEKAEELEIVVLDKRRELLGDDHLDTLLAMNNLGWTYYCQNRFVDAEEILVAALDKLKSLVGDDHPDTQCVLQNLVWTYQRLTKWKEAAELEKLIHNDASIHEQSLEKLEDQVKAGREFLGDDDFQTLRAMHWLANRYRTLGQFEDAEKLEAVVLDKWRKLLGDDHLHTLFAMNNLGQTYYCQNRFLEAQEVLVPALDKLRSLVGDDHPDTQRVLQNLVWTYQKLNESPQEQSLEELEELLTKQRRILGDDHWQILKTMQNLVVKYDGLGQIEESEKLEVVVLEQRRKLLGDDHLDTLDAMNDLGYTYYCQGHFVKAEKLLVVALDKRRQLLGDDNVHTLTTMQNLARTYGSLGRFEEAEKLKVVVLEKRRELLGDDHLDTLLAMNNLGWTYYCQNRFVEAEEIFLAILDKLRQLVCDDYPDTQRVLQNLVWTYQGLNKHEEAAELEKLICDDDAESSEDEEGTH
ncbi:FabD/lysophospholipase-like protein [Mycena sanguinolenta]|uniref:FabD/lysophospholipase-like protein n=1 Tax=Mycena sanguinolenta TaxID=230812 RepID=A0A8H7D2Z5_9AGAR|nr:FabD/lysophospholipase-like protein [Mycena sanguinolenta]